MSKLKFTIRKFGGPGSGHHGHGGLDDVWGGSEPSKSGIGGKVVKGVTALLGVSKSWIDSMKKKEISKEIEVAERVGRTGAASLKDVRSVAKAAARNKGKIFLDASNEELPIGLHGRVKLIVGQGASREHLAVLIGKGDKVGTLRVMVQRHDVLVDDPSERNWRPEIVQESKFKYDEPKRNILVVLEPRGLF